MSDYNPVKKKLAESFIRQREPSHQNKLIAKYLVAFVFLFLVHTYFSNLETPLKMIPQTMAAVGMGYVLFLISAIKQFSHVIDFIDWEIVETYAEQKPGESSSHPTV